MVRIRSRSPAERSKVRCNAWLAHPLGPHPHQSLVTAVRFIVSKTPGFGSSLTAITVRAGR